MGLQTKIFLYTAVGFLALMSLLTWISAQTNNQAAEMVQQERLAIVENIASGIDDIIEHLNAEMTETALVLGRKWQGHLSEIDEQELFLLRERLRRYLKLSPESESVTLTAVLDPGGNIYWTDPSLAEIIGLSLADKISVSKVIANGRMYIGTEGVLLPQGSPQALSFLAPIEDSSGTLLGILVAEIPAESVARSLGTFLQRQEGDYTAELVTDTGAVLASSYSSLPVGESLHWESIRLLSQQQETGIVEHKHQEERKHLVAFASLTQLSGGIILSRSEEQALVLPWMGESPFLVTGLVLVLAAGLMWLVARQIVSPLRRLAVTAQKFGSGDLDAAVTVDGKDEIGKLAETLDAMRSQLKQSLDEIGGWNRELEQRVKERTSELEYLERQLREQNKERTELLGKIITTQEEERKRIARELHDEVGQSITSLMIGFRVLESQGPEKMQQGIAELKRLSARTLDEVRHLALELRPSSLDDLGLIPALKQYTREYAEKFGMNADFQASGFEGKRLQPEVEIALYRIIQEALTNVVKHSGAKKVSVLMGVRNSSIVAIVEDNGKGFDVRSVLALRQKEHKLGLYGMQERASLIGGVLTIESTPGTGTTIFVEVPFKGDEK